MESYEKIRKMGEISKQLKQHGLVSDTFDAQKEAEKIMGRNNEFYVSQEDMKKIQEKNEIEKKAHKESSNSEEEKTIVNSNIVQNLTNKVNMMESMMNLMRDKMNEIITKINELETKTNYQPKQEVQSKLNYSESSKETKIAEEPAKEDKAQLNKDVKGEYTTEDVSVDKMFYFGKK